MLETGFTRLVGCKLPIQCAAMPGVATLELAGAVSNAGGLGMIGTPMIPPPALAEMLDDLAQRTKAPCGVNFLMPFLEPECLAAVVDEPLPDLQESR
ncbi:MAG: nitronate monooxygenase [Deltaproteobacteria bacterium]|nr:nitronate monooxygenase [Deltaproteobacteria bacterium]